MESPESEEPNPLFHDDKQSDPFVLSDDEVSNAMRIDALYAWIHNGQIWPSEYTPEGKFIS